jgi:hypothetical protein
MGVKMMAKISLWFGPIRADKVIETANGEIFSVNYCSNRICHETWFNLLDEERKNQILTQVAENDDYCTEKTMAEDSRATAY